MAEPTEEGNRVPRVITDRLYKYTNTLHFHRDPKDRFGCSICEALDDYREEVGWVNQPSKS